MTLKTRNFSDGAVTQAKMAAGAIDTAGFLTGAAIAASKLADANFETNFTTGKLVDGLGVVRTLRAVYSIADGDLGTQAGHTLTGAILPAFAVVVGGYMHVVTIPVGVGASIAVGIESTTDIVNTAAISGAPWSSTGRKAIIPKFTTPESTSVKVSVPRSVVVTGSGANLTAGKFYVVLHYVVSIVSA